MKKLCCLILAIFVFSSSVSVQAEFSVSAQSCILMEGLTGHVLYEKDADAVLPMASTTKLFTALMVRECCELDEVVTVSQKASQTEGSSAYLAAGERLTVEQLLYALLLSSGNDAAEVLAEHAFDGDRNAFVDYMNRRAQELGFMYTHFTNPSGLPDDGHYTTARELALIGRMAQQDPIISRIAASKTISFTTVNDITHSYTNHNSLLRMYSYATGLKTGYTKAAGRCLVSSAEKDGVTLICVTLNAPDDWDDHMALYDYGFSRVSLFCRLSANESEISVPVVGGMESEVMASSVTDIDLPLVDDEFDYQLQYTAEPILFAPITKGQAVGKIYVKLDNQILSEYELVAQSNIDAVTVENNFFWNEIKRIFNFLLL